MITGDNAATAGVVAAEVGITHVMAVRRGPGVHAHLDAAREEIRAFAAFPRGLWRQIWFNNPNELLNREIRRLTESSALFPTAARSYAWSAPSWPSTTTNGQTDAGTSVLRSSPRAA